MKGKGNQKEEANIKNSVFWVNIFLSILVFIGVNIFSFFVEDSYKLPLRILSVLVSVQMFYYYYYSFLRSYSNFITVSNGIFLTSILSTVFVVAFAYAFTNPILGGLIGLGLSSLIVLIYWIRESSYTFPFGINWVTIKKCSIMGIPILAIGILDSLTLSIDRMFIAVYMNETQLGYYALGIMISGILSVIPGSVASVLYTTMLERFAVRHDPKDVKSLLLGPMRLIWALMITIIGVIIVALPALIHLLIPKYSPSIPIVQMLIFGSFFMSTSLLPGQFLIAVNKQKFLIVTQIIICIMVLLIDMLLIHYGYGLKGIAVGTICGYFVYGVGYTCIALNLVVENLREIMKYLVWQVFPFIMLLLTYLVLNIFFPDKGTTLNYILWAIFKIIILLSSLFVYLWIVNRDGLVFDFVKSELLKLFNRFLNKEISN
jgi:O-antigen/teichoic acid export membrane protein